MSISTPTTQKLFQELDYRENCGIEVSLLRDPSTGTLSVFVCDTTSDDVFELSVPAADAADAFRHPYAYRARMLSR